MCTFYLYLSIIPQCGLHKTSNIDCIRWVLRRYTKRLPGLKSYPYKGRLKRLNLTTLEVRWLHIDLVWCHKIVFGLVDVNLDDFFILAPLSQTRDHKHKLYKRWHVIFSKPRGWCMNWTTCLKTSLILIHCQPLTL